MVVSRESTEGLQEVTFTVIYGGEIYIEVISVLYKTCNMNHLKY